MADIIADGKTRVYWVSAIASIAAPTVAEADAGFALNSTITSDGLVGFEADTAAVDTGALDSTFDTTRGGRAAYSGTMLRLKKQTGTDTIYDTLTRGTTGYIVIRRSVAAATAWTAGQDVEVYPVECGEVKRLQPEPNTVERYEVPLFVTDEPDLRAQVA